jgi:hypothetical protein
VVVLDALFLMSFKYLVFVARDGKLLFIIFHDAQHSIELMCPCAECRILVCLQDAVYSRFLAFHVVDSSAKRVRSAVIFARRVLSLTFVLAGEFRPPHLYTVKNFGGCKSQEVLMIRGNRERRGAFGIYSLVLQGCDDDEKFSVMVS